MIAVFYPNINKIFQLKGEIIIAAAALSLYKWSIIVIYWYYTKNRIAYGIIYEKEVKSSYKGKRITRGLFLTETGKKVNADVNASYNIMMKVFHEEDKLRNIYKTSLTKISI